MIKYSFITINYNSFDYTYNCIQSIRQIGCSVESEIIVIDNHSKDGSGSLLEEQFPDVHFIFNHKNLGFAAACNQGINAARGDYLILINNDVVIIENFLEKIEDTFNSVKELGLLGYQLLNKDGSLQKTDFSFPTLQRRIWHLTFAPLYRKHGQKFRTISDHKQIIKSVDYIKGALMILSSKILDEIDLNFDENYFMYHEEMDLAFNLKKLGYICCLDTQPVAIHFGQNDESVYNVNVFKLRQKNLIYFYKKNYSSMKFVLLCIINVILLSMKYSYSFWNSNRRKCYGYTIKISILSILRKFNY